MYQPLISVVVPVYNVKKYLEKCINSILNQSYDNTEVILVDDGSTDGSSLLCDELKKKTTKIKVIHKQNAGLGLARNSGLEIIEGSYVTFIDSDDWVNPDYIQHMYNAMIENHVDFCKSGFQQVKHNGEVVSITKYLNELYEGENASKNLLPRMIGSAPETHDSIEMCVCAVLYNADIIRKHSIVFPSERILICEDLVFNIDYMQYANGACTIDNVDYNYRINEVSLSHRYRSDRIEASSYFYRYIKNELIDLGYGKDTILRLDRMFFIHTRMSISQERKIVSGHNRKTSIMKIDNICSNETVQEAISEYPVERLGLKQRLFLQLVSGRKSGLLYCFAEIGLL